MTDTPRRGRLRHLWQRTRVGLYLDPEPCPELRRWDTAANRVTLAGAAAVAVYAWTLWAEFAAGNPSGLESPRLWLVAAVIVSDGLDGFLARARRECTRVGAVLDPVRDKLFAVVAGLHMALADGSGEALVLLSLMALGECFILGHNLLGGVAVHAAGKLRMAVHMGCAAAFVAGATIVPGLRGDPEILLSLMLAATAGALYTYTVHPRLAAHPGGHPLAGGCG